MYVSSHTLHCNSVAWVPRTFISMFYLCVISTLTGFYIYILSFTYLKQIHLGMKIMYIICVIFAFQNNLDAKLYTSEACSFKRDPGMWNRSALIFIKHIVLNKNHLALLQVLPAKLHQLFFWHKASLEQVGLRASCVDGETRRNDSSLEEPQLPLRKRTPTTALSASQWPGEEVEEREHDEDTSSSPHWRAVCCHYKTEKCLKRKDSQIAYRLCSVSTVKWK